MPHAGRFCNLLANAIMPQGNRGGSPVLDFAGSRTVLMCDPLREGIRVARLKRSTAKARAADPAVRSPLRLAVTLLALLTFAFQSYATQTHIHKAGGLLGGLGLAAAADVKSGPQGKTDKYPGNQDPSNCPICQQMVHSGSFVTPSTLAALPPVLSISIIALRLEAAIATQPVSHSWHGRAPPHA